MIEGGTVQLPVRDVERALRFYIERLGVKLVQDAVLDLGAGFGVELVRADTVTPQTLVLYVRDFDEAIATYENRGLVFTTDAKSAECTDLDGHHLRFVAR